MASSSSNLSDLRTSHFVGVHLNLQALYLVCFFVAGNVETGKREGKIPGHHSNYQNGESHDGHDGHVFALALSTDGQYLVGGYVVYYLQYEQPCCIGYTNSNRSTYIEHVIRMDVNVHIYRKS